MLQRVVRILGQVVRPVVVVGAPQQDLPLLPADVLIARDEVSDRGPLQGLAAGLAALRGRSEAAYACSCDVPLLQEAFVARMVELLSDHQIAVPFVDDFHHPLAAVYRVEVLDQINVLLAARRRRPIFLFESANAIVITRPQLLSADPNLNSLRNCNRPEEYEKALADAGFAG